MEEINDLHTLDATARDVRVRKVLNGLQQGEKVRFVVPYFKSSIGQSIFPVFTEMSFTQYLEIADVGFGYVFIDQPTMDCKTEEVRAFMVRHYWDVVSHLIVEMTKK